MKKTSITEPVSFSETSQTTSSPEEQTAPGSSGTNQKKKDLSPLVKRIKTQKKSQGYTNITLAAASGLTISEISKLLSGDIGDPRFSNVQKIADALNCSLDYLSEGESAPKYKTSSRQEYTLLDSYRKLNDSGQEALLSYCNYLLQQNNYLKGDAEPDTSIEEKT